MWPFKKKKNKQRERASQFLLGVGIALILVNLPIYSRAYLVIGLNEALAAIIVGFVFAIAGIYLGMMKK
jgi:putative flippase GtrA